MWSAECSVTSPSSNHMLDPSPRFVPGHIHTVNTHPEQWAAIYAAAPGEQLGVRCLARGHLSRVIEGGESAGHSLQLQKKLREYILCAKKIKINTTLLNNFFSSVSVFDERITNKKYSRSFINLRLNHWCHMDHFNDLLTTFLVHKTIQLRCCLCRVRKLSDLIKNILICVPKMKEGLTGLEWHEGE